MKLNDPFGRMERRHQVTYEVVRDSLSRNDIKTVEGAEKIIRDTRMRALKFLAATAVIALLVGWLLPRALLAVAAVALLAVAWTINWTINGERCIRRYIKEELGGGKAQD